jgi:hypothetical protein
MEAEVVGGIVVMRYGENADGCSKGKNERSRKKSCLKGDLQNL